MSILYSYSPTLERSRLVHTETLQLVMDYHSFLHAGSMPVDAWYTVAGQLRHDTLLDVAFYHPLDASTEVPDESKRMFYIPHTVRSGDVFILAADIFARIGGNSKTPAEAKVSLTEAESAVPPLWDVDLNAWDGQHELRGLLGEHQRLRSRDLIAVSVDTQDMTPSQRWAAVMRQIAAEKPLLYVSLTS